MTYLEKIEAQVNDSEMEQILMNVKDVKMLLIEAKTWAEYVKRTAIINHESLFGF